MFNRPKPWLFVLCWTALVFLGGCGISRQFGGTKSIRVMTYNIHHGVGTDSTFDIKRIAEVVNDNDADIVALQGVDRWTKRVSRMDLMTKLADLTGMTYTFARSGDTDGGEYGNGLLTRFPILEEKPVVYRYQSSQRECSLMRLVLDVRGTEMVLLNTELLSDEIDSLGRENIGEIQSAAKEYPNTPVILCGSLQSPPQSAAVASLSKDFLDCWSSTGQGEGFTYPSAAPKDRYDYLFVSESRIPTDTKSFTVALKPVWARVIDSNASDHLPLVVTLDVVSD